MNALRTLLVIAWASPVSTLGLLAGALGLATGGAVARQGRVLEFWGGAVTCGYSGTRHSWRLR